MKIVMLNSGIPNPRRRKRLLIEKRIGDVTLVCWDRSAHGVTSEQAEGCRVHCIQCAAQPGAAYHLIERSLAEKKFAKRAEEIIAKIQPDIIHAENLDMLRIACTIKRRWIPNVSILYEIPDLHALLVDKQRNPVKMAAQQYLLWLERRCCRQIDRLIITSPKFYDSHFKKFVPQQKVLFLPNMPNLKAFEAYRRKDGESPFTVGFIGQMLYMEQMQYMLEACRRNNLNMLAAGFEADRSGKFERACKAYDRCEWIGRFEFARQAAELYGKCDLIYLVYNADWFNVQVLLPNKLYEAILCEVPVVVAKGTYLAELVEGMGVGVSVNHKDPEEIAEVIGRLSLRQDDYWRMVSSCKKNKDMLKPEQYNALFETCLLECGAGHGQQVEESK